ncbi:hypothetical protein DPR00_32865 [Burkholderia pseudomallei]|nr:hypothetical protein CF641_32780 [Burkholderia pseudomallei]RAP79638.1 hypothetical protein DPQ97_33655 [Burkholderia pseudomallei]RAP80645.1 hypothetical protein DPR01_34040 [Burkholderia pseudomallei]RAP85577.1 hypothetical protein DPQ99_33180 [Burkholderia pseudomallei]RAQ09758.1 hypothetical protein DPR00_32865 [Burkholderia pseudomallei]
MPRVASRRVRRACVRGTAVATGGRAKTRPEAPRRLPQALRVDVRQSPPRPRYYLHAPIIGALASQARHDSRPQSLMIRGVLSPGLVGGW